MQTKPYVLAVDDEPVNRYILEDFLEEAFELLVLESGQACLHAVRQRKPDLILMDISMPGMDGYEVCRRLQSDPQTREIPLIFLTAKVETMDEKLGFDLGAVDYITKPFTEAILLARIRTHLSLSAARRRLETHNAVLCRERAHVEEMILRMREDTQFVAQGIQCLLTPLERTNGDLLLSAQTPDGRRYLMIGDFTGHGLPAALGGPLVASLFYLLAEQGAPLETIVQKLNQALFSKLSAEWFMAALFIEWCVEEQQVRVWNHGMPELLHFRQTRLHNRIQANRFALGILADLPSSAPCVELSVAPGDHLFVYSDGAIEARNLDGEAFGKDRLIETLTAFLAQQRSFDSIYEAIRLFAQGSGLQDDVTLLHLAID